MTIQFAKMTMPKRQPTRGRYDKTGSIQGVQGPAPAGQSFDAQSTHKVGETKEWNGHTYRLGESHRWERVDKDEANPQQPAQPSPANDQAQRHAFVASKVKSLHPELGGLIQAIHESPDYKSAGEYVSFDVHKKVAADLHHSLSKRMGQEHGGGKIVDLGQGRVGFASEAGSLVVWPADETGRHRVSYTNKTGIVGRAMTQGGGQGEETNGPPPAGGAPGQAEQAQPAAEADEREPVPPPRPGVPRGKPVEQPQQPAPAGQPGPAPQQQPASGKLPDEEAYDAELVPAKEKPAHVRLRARANQSKQRFQDAFAKYEQAVDERERSERIRKLKRHASELRQIANEHHRQASRAEAGHKSRLRESGKQTKARMKQLGIGPYKPKQKPAKGPVEPKESLPKGTMPDDKAKLSRSFFAGGNRGSIQFESEQHRDLYDLGAKHQYVGRGGRNKTSDRHVGDIKALTAKLAESTGMSEQELRGHAAEVYKHTKGQMKGIADGEHRAVKMPTTKDTAPLVERAEQNKGQGQVPEVSPEALEMGKLPGESQRAGAAAQTYLKTAGLTVSPENHKAIQHAIRKGWIKNKQELRGVLRRAKAFHDKSGSHKYHELRGITDKAQRSAKRAELASSDHHALKDAIRRKANRERRTSWASIVRQKANDWDMPAKEFHDTASKFYQEHYVAEHDAREAARKEARKRTGLTQKDINKLENEGFDYGSDHPKIKNLDTIGRSLAEEFPELGWGHAKFEENAGADEGDHDANLWALLREGKQRRPSKTDPEFMDAFQEALQDGYSLTPEVEREEISPEEGERRRTADDSVPFAKVRNGQLMRYLQERFSKKDRRGHWHRGQGKNGGQFAPSSEASGGDEPGDSFVDIQVARQKRATSSKLKRKDLLADLQSMFDDHAILGQNRTTGPERCRFASAAKSLLPRLSDKAMQAVSANTKHVVYHHDFDSVSKLHGDRVCAFYDRDDQSLHLNGSDTPERLEYIYSHEIAHAIDGPDASYSSTDEWKRIWNEELLPADLPTQAKESADEGWAFFGTDAILSPEDAKENFPRAWQFWEARGLTS